MPHIEIKCYPGRSKEQKRLCAEKVAQAAAEALGCKLSSVSVAIKEIEKENWKKDVWDKQIVPDEKYLYKKPEYKM
ncbi:MAG: tautomerase family protein [Ruminococcus sp.]|nr:tautomerase family protein [Ruminococcus sp.]